MRKMSDEKFLKIKGWEKVKGYYIDLEELRNSPDEWEKFYFRKDDFSDFVIECDFWVHGDIESVYEDADTLIETEYEEYLDGDGNLYDEEVEYFK